MQNDVAQEMSLEEHVRSTIIQTGNQFECIYVLTTTFCQGYKTIKCCNFKVCCAIPQGPNRYM